MEIKYISSEKITDQSSNKSSISEKINLNKQQQKNKNENKLISQKPPIIVDRKLTMEPQIFRKEFVPILKPIEIHLVPSKLRLNKFTKKIEIIIMIYYLILALVLKMKTNWIVN